MHEAHLEELQGWAVRWGTNDGKQGSQRWQLMGAEKCLAQPERLS